MKKIFCLLLLLAMTLPLCACSLLNPLVILAVIGDDHASKEEIFEFVQNNESDLLSAIESGDLASLEGQGIVQEINTKEKLIDFYCGGAGFGSATSYVGFYYSPEDDMTAMWYAPENTASLLPCEKGFEWLQPDGDNRYYTENICGHFYYYEASF